MGCGAPVRPRSVEEKPALKESQVSFKGVGGMELRGTLLKPAGSSLPAVLLLPGSGPTDRDGNQPPTLMTDVLKQMAESLADAGIASLRFDKRAAAGYSAGWPKEIGAIDKFFSWDNFVGDAKAALAFLHAQEGVDPERTAIVGHSEGGSLAIQIGHDLAGKKGSPKALVLMATPGRPYGPIIQEQVAASLGRAKMSSSQVKTYMDWVDLAISDLKSKGTIPPNAPEGLGPLFNPSSRSLMRSYLTIDPLLLLAKFSGPVLVLQGAKDIQVSPERDAAALVKTLDKRGGSHDYLLVAGASHNFKAVVNSEIDPGFTGPMLKEALDKLTSWLKNNL